MSNFVVIEIVLVSQFRNGDWYIQKFIQKFIQAVGQLGMYIWYCGRKLLEQDRKQGIREKDIRSVMNKQGECLCLGLYKWDTRRPFEGISNGKDLFRRIEPA